MPKLAVNKISFNSGSADGTCSSVFGADSTSKSCKLNLFTPGECVSSTAGDMNGLNTFLAPLAQIAPSHYPAVNTTTDHDAMEAEEHTTGKNILISADYTQLQQESLSKSEETSQLQNKQQEHHHHHQLLQHDAIVSSVAGEAHKLKRLVFVRSPLGGTYECRPGDLVVGRITEVLRDAWRVELGAMRLATLQLANLNLPGGELRVRGDEDERTMRELLNEGDLVAAEVRQLKKEEGRAVLMMRETTQGKLGQGVLLRAPPFLIPPSKVHTHTLPNGVTIVLGCNGFIWIGPTQPNYLAFQLDDAAAATSSSEQNLAVIRVRNCVVLLIEAGLSVSEANLQATLECVARSAYSNSDLLHPRVHSQLIESLHLQLFVEMRSAEMNYA